MFNADDLATLNDLELDLYNYIVAHQNDVLTMTIRELAHEAHVSTTTILRFCKKLHFQGFSEFKLYAKMQLTNAEPTHLRTNTDIILEYFKRIDNEAFNTVIDQAATIIAKTSTVFLLGIGTSGILAKYASRYFSNIGKFTQYIDDPFFPIKIEDETVIIALSVSGETKEMIQAISQMKNEHTTIISITNSGNNTIAKITDLNINYYLPLEVKADHVNLTSQVPVVHILESIAKRIFEVNATQ
ncbi:MurR/RpiR family transcriptional regulator [Erysipelothrix sp. HDW6C]|uniref:MurR/RpiR family transcriptional regulator n=1 Tax=Erysipelothrix sp. HDW6C TaxID=2714930 RepID=UPI0014093C8B|nr:MurR/RpiR family transcriptional regulator [Erysipelothrix sp. HDW6C]QIK70384.1 MurR/RpiR family transcriptional regulator [Erysipelothrix sp. HDW6C]